MAWGVKKLFEIGNVFSGNSINAKTKKEKFLNINSGLPYVATKDISYDSNIDYDNGIKIPENELRNFKIAHKRSILICAEGGSAGRKLAFNTKDVCFVNKLFALETFNFMEPRFVYYFYHTAEFQHQFKSQMTGIIGGVSMGKFKNLEIPIPPLTEQERIVAILDKTFENITKAKENAGKNLRNAKEIFENYLQNIFEKKGEGWVEKKLGEIATFRNGMNFTKGSKGEVIKIVGVRNFQNFFWVPLENLESVTIDGKLNEIDFLKENDILAVRSNGNPELIGRTLLTGEVIGKTSHSGFTIRIRLNSKIIFPLYLCHYLKTQRTRKELVKSGTGVNIKSLNQVSLSFLSISFPKSISEQHSIVKKLDAFSFETKKLKSIYNQKLADLEELKQSILQKAFNGELTEELT